MSATIPIETRRLIAAMVANGTTTKEIARFLGMKVPTINLYRRRIFAGLDIGKEADCRCGKPAHHAGRCTGFVVPAKAAPDPKRRMSVPVETGYWTFLEPPTKARMMAGR